MFLLLEPCKVVFPIKYTKLSFFNLKVGLVVCGGLVFFFGGGFHLRWIGRVYLLHEQL